MERLNEITAEAEPRPELAISRERDTIKAQMATRNGRRFMWMVIEQSSPLRNPMAQGFTEFNVGKQDIGRWLLDMIFTHCPETYTTMLREAKEDEAYDYGRSTDPSN